MSKVPNEPDRPDPSDADVAAFIARMRLPEPAPGGHPRWCFGLEAANAPHMSRAVYIHPDSTDGTRVALFVQQSPHTDDRAPELVIQFDDGTLTEYVITLAHGKRLGREIGDLIALAGGGR